MSDSNTDNAKIAYS